MEINLKLKEIQDLEEHKERFTTNDVEKLKELRLVEQKLFGQREEFKQL